MIININVFLGLQPPRRNTKTQKYKKGKDPGKKDLQLVPSFPVEPPFLSRSVTKDTKSMRDIKNFDKLILSQSWKVL